MKRLENNKENRMKQCEKEIELINNELNNPNNFVVNKYAKEARESIIIEKGD